MSKRFGNFAGGSNSKRLKYDVAGVSLEDDVWGDDFEADDIEECLIVATQKCSQDIRQSESSILPSYNSFVPNININSTLKPATKEHIANDLQVLIEEKKQLVVQLESKDGEVSILRSQLNHLMQMHKDERSELIKKSERKAAEFEEQLATYNKDILSLKCELDLKALEISNLKEKLHDAQVGRSSSPVRSTPVQRVVTSKSKITSSCQTENSSAILRDFYFPTNVEFLAVLNRNISGTKFEDEELHPHFKSLESSWERVKYLNEHELNSSKFAPELKTILTVCFTTLEKCQQFTKSCEGRALAEVPDERDDRLYSNANTSDICLVLLNFLSLKNNNFRRDVVKILQGNSSALARALLDITKCFANTKRKEIKLKMCRALLSFCLAVVQEASSNANTLKTIHEMLREIVLSKPPDELVLTICDFLQNASGRPELINLLCVNHKFSEKSTICTFEVLCDLFDEYSAPDSIAQSVFRLFYNIICTDTDWASVSTSSGCSCLQKMCRQSMDLLHELTQRCDFGIGPKEIESDNALKCGLILLRVLSVRFEEVFLKSADSSVKYQAALRHLANLESFLGCDYPLNQLPAGAAPRTLEISDSSVDLIWKSCFHHSAAHM